MEILAAAALAVLCFGLIGIAFAVKKSTGQGFSLHEKFWKGRSLWLWLLPVFLSAGMMRAQRVKNLSEDELALGLDGRTVALQGTVLELREQDKWIVMVLECGRQEEMAPRRIQVYLESPAAEPDSSAVKSLSGGLPAIGNQVQVIGECASFEEARNPGEFDYRLYYRSLKLNYRMFAKSCKIVDKRYDRYREGLRRCAVWAADRLELLTMGRTGAGAVGTEAAGAETASAKNAGVFRAMLLGDKSGLPEDIRDLYQKNGIAHLLAVSGLHLSLVSLAAYGVLRKLGAGYGMAGLAGGAVLCSYALLTGASPSVIRALIMVLCGFWAAYLGRTYDLLSALGLSALCLLWDSPYLLCQAGVQLSFGAIIGIGGLAVRLYRDGAETWEEAEKLGESEKEEKTGKPGKSGISQGFAVSAGMQMMTLPVILYHFFQYPLYGVFLNLLVVPLVGIVIASGAAGIAAGSISMAAGRFAIGSGCAVLGWYEWCCMTFERLPGSNIIWGRPEFWQIGAYYGILLSAVWIFKGSGRKVAVSFFAAVLMLVVVPPGGLEVAFLDVGQGDGICLRTRQVTVFVDGGSSDEKKLGESRMEPFLKSRGIRTVDYWMVSHGDQDHISGLIYLLQEGDIAISNLILPAAGFGDKVYERLETMAQLRGCTVAWMEKGDCLQAGRLRIMCLYPDSVIHPSEMPIQDKTAMPQMTEMQLPVETDRNEHSLVLQVDYEQFHMLLTGDMSGEGEEKLMEVMQAEAAQLPDIQVLKAAHHGSRFSTTSRWLETVSPEWAVISCGRENRYGHPHPETMERLEEKDVSVFETDRDGAVILRTNGKTIRFNTWLKSMLEESRESR